MKKKENDVEEVKEEEKAETKRKPSKPVSKSLNASVISFFCSSVRVGGFRRATGRKADEEDEDACRNQQKRQIQTKKQIKSRENKTKEPHKDHSNTTSYQETREKKTTRRKPEKAQEKSMKGYRGHL